MSIPEEGVRFQCQQCGACCSGAPGTVYMTEEEIKHIAAHLHASVDGLKTTYLYPFRDSYSAREEPNGDCIFFRNGGCFIYPVRPEQCRTYPFWIRSFRSDKNWEETTRECPGIGEGPLFSHDEIEKRLAEGNTP